MLADRVRGLRRQLIDAESLWSDQIAAVHERNLVSALNLVHDWAIRRADLRELRHRLAAFGLSSLIGCEPHVQASLEAIAATVDALSGRDSSTRRPVVGLGAGAALQRGRAVELFGAQRPNRPTRMMVTLPPQAATDPSVVRELLEDGMDLARIDCAQDDPAAWQAIMATYEAPPPQPAGNAEWPWVFRDRSSAPVRWPTARG